MPLILSLVGLENIILTDKDLSDDSSAMGISSILHTARYNSEPEQFPVE